MKFHIVIPARYNSSRLPGKPLLQLNGKPMIWHVFQRAIESNVASVTVATDDVRIMDVVSSFGGYAMLTKNSHVSGTDRISEVAKIMNFSEDDVVINLQGDEPLVSPSCIGTLIDAFANEPLIDIATLSANVSNYDDVINPNVVKVVTDNKRRALYFSRAPIPWDRESFSNNPCLTLKSNVYERHIGIYAYKVKKLLALSELPSTALENLESLEQLRALQNGMSIYVEKLDYAPHHGVDTREDYERIRAIMELRK